ncbi:MAG: methylmalonyl Co-A mutase-associated GTPase MeaB [Caldimonas sp.]
MLPAGDQALLDAIAAGAGESQRRAVAKSITLLESTRADHRARADAFLTALPAPARPAFRLGVSGVPGVGKSTFIEALGLHLVAAGERVAVLAVDPSSSVSGGSILGDKTRMERLSVDARAFVRPSPSSGTLGGVAAATREAMRVVEAAGYSVVIVETVGVGQSEAAVAGMTDMFVLLQLPNAGDDLQAIKKGVMELADLVVVNKADLDAAAAARAVRQITSALHMASRRAGSSWPPRAVALSALDDGQVAGIWQLADSFREAQRLSGADAERRRTQALSWFWERIDAGLRQSFRGHGGVRSQLVATLDAVDAGRLPATVAARRLLTVFGAAEQAASSPAAAAERA